MLPIASNEVSVRVLAWIFGGGKFTLLEKWSWGGGGGHFVTLSIFIPVDE